MDLKRHDWFQRFGNVKWNIACGRVITGRVCYQLGYPVQFGDGDGVASMVTDPTRDNSITYKYVKCSVYYL